VPGEEIVGYVTRGKGIAVHSSSCPNVRNLMFNPDREISVSWGEERPSQFRIDLAITIEDRQGVLAKVVSSVANLKTNISHIESRTGEGKVVVEMVIDVADLKHLEKVIKSISSIDSVLRVERKYNIRHATA
jgi:GTP diphosphokinase / guanosine-3',5'-bis(diphosphate) 3'-diphosphatase